MKKTLSTIAGLGLALTLTACSSESNATEDSYGERLDHPCDAGAQCEVWMSVTDTKIVDRCPEGQALEGDNLTSGDTKLLRLAGQAAVENVESSTFLGVDPSFWLWVTDADGTQYQLSEVRRCRPEEENSWSWVSRHHTENHRISIYEVPAGVHSMETSRGATDEPGHWPIN